MSKPPFFTLKLLITGIFLAIYLSASLSLLMSPRVRGAGYHENDLYFQADSEFFAKRVAKDRHTYDRIRYHPLFVIFFNPVGRSMNTLTRNPEVSACILNALAGSICVYLALTLFYDALQYPPLRSVLYAIIFGLTSTQFIFSIVPDTFIFTSLGFVGLLIIMLRYRSLTSWIGITVYSIGITITNVVPAFLAAYFFLFRSIRQIRIKPRRLYGYIIGVMSISAILSIAQKLLYNVWLFSQWKKIHEEDIDWYLYMPTNWAENWDRLGLLMKHVVLFCVAPPQIQVTTHFLNPDISMVTFMETPWWGFPAASWPAAILWVLFLGLAIFYVFQQKLYQQPLIQFILLCLAFNVALHFLYGDDFMLFSCDWLIFLLLLVFFTLEQSPLAKRYARQYQIGLVAFAVSLLMASGWLMHDLYNAFLIQ
uniref:Uncharacterized protein n=1 Tax=Roseihalotalea indica TaxID=2867963 RepID=A0AA49JHP1_9BACT|nr:hypothetical protein K4G66_11850 [Tunicatimonas sp. TK19036]